MSVSEVLHHAADLVEHRERWRIDRDWRKGCGGDVFVTLLGAGGELYGAPAVALVERVLRADLSSGQLQHWHERDPAAVAKVLRDAAGLPPAPDVEVATARGELARVHARLCDALGRHYSLGEALERVVDRLDWLERERMQLDARMRRRREKPATQ